MEFTWYFFSAHNVINPDLNIFKFERNRTELFTLILHSYELALLTRFVVHRVQSYIFLEKKKNDNQNSVFSL